MNADKSSHKGSDGRPPRENLERIVQEVVDSKLAKWKLALSCFLAGFGAFVLLGATWSDFRHFLFEKAYPPDVAYKKLKETMQLDSELRTRVANDILKLIGERVDSGYSKTFYYVGGNPPPDGQDIIQFYALPQQVVELTVIAQGPEGGSFVVTVDNKNPYATRNAPNPKFPSTIVKAPIAGFLDFPKPMELQTNREEEQNLGLIHTLRIAPEHLPRGTTASFEVLVLVRNQTV